MRNFMVPAALWLAGCSNLDDPSFGKGDPADLPDVTDDTAETADDTSSPDDTDETDPYETESGGESGEETGGTDPQASFDEVGDIAVVEDDNGVVTVDLSDSSGDSNRDQEFYLLLLNSSSDAIGYDLRYFPGGSSGPPRPPPAPRRVQAREPAMPVPPAERQTTAAPPPPLSSADIGVSQEEFQVRIDVEDTEAFAPVAATLWAYGENIAIYVDNEVYIDWDIDCDGTVDVPDPNGASGFDNCDLSDVVEIVDSNVVPNLRSYFGDESDINGDGRITVVITPQLNAITTTSDDEADHYRVLPSYTEPEVDLQPFSVDTNPGSDEQEVVYVYAPDPYGFFNPLARPEVETFTSYQLAGEIARSLTALISYNQHVLVGGGSPEADWVNDSLGTLAADLCGFGAAFYGDAWEYLDAPHLQPLVASDLGGSLDNFARGAQYTFGRWLYDRAEAAAPGSGVDLMLTIMQSGLTSTDGIEYATGQDFADLAIAWQVALLTDDVLDADGDPMVEAADWPQYAAPTTISAPPSSPGSYYGANGYQRGLEIRGRNYGATGGTTDSPSRSGSGWRIEGQDAFTYTPGFTFTGYVEGGFATDVVRLTGITYDEALVRAEATSEGLIGVVIRWNDPDTLDYTVEAVFSPTDVNPVPLPAFPADGSRIRGVGELSGPTTVTIVTEDAEEDEEAVESLADSDRWLLDLTSRSGSVPVAVWLNRHFADTNGASGPEDPWVAIVPEDYVPVPTVDGTQTNASCVGAPTFSYPVSMLEYLYAQVFVASTMQDGDEEDLELPGTVTSPECTADWDLDGIADEDEPVPETFLGQIWLQQYALNDNMPPAVFYSRDWMDADEQDDDERYTFAPHYNAGGRAGVDGEEGFASAVLQGGERYLLVVGDSGGGGGVYEIVVRELTE